MKLLIIGGTVFLGRALVEAARTRGHTITLFNRGQSNPNLFPDVEQIHGDRAGALSALRNRRWDAAIDTCGYVPRIVQMSAEALAKSVEHYTFISTISVYADVSRPGVNEQSLVGTLDDPSVEDVTGESYGPLKALSERAAAAALPGRVLTLRPGLIVGPYDPTDRFSYWPYRVAQGGEVLAPGRPDRIIQFIDVRDLAEWTIRMVEQRQTGVYNVDGPAQSYTLGDLLATCKAVTNSDATFTWVREPFLAEQAVEPWIELPLWLPETPEYGGFYGVDCSKAIGAGLTFRPVAETVRATIDYLTTLPLDREWRAGLTREREAELLRDWHARTTAQQPVAES